MDSAVVLSITRTRTASSLQVAIAARQGKLFRVQFALLPFLAFLPPKPEATARDCGSLPEDKELTSPNLSRPQHTEPRWETPRSRPRCGPPPPRAQAAAAAAASAPAPPRRSPTVCSAVSLLRI